MYVTIRIPQMIWMNALSTSRKYNHQHFSLGINLLRDQGKAEFDACGPCTVYQTAAF